VAVSASALAQPKKKLWYDEIIAIHGKTSTGNEYTRYNNLLQVWHNREYGKNVEITETAVRKYVQQQSLAGKSTQVLVAALRFRFMYCEQRSFDLSKLIKESAQPNKHRYLKKEERESVFMRMADSPLMQLSCRLLFDLGARVQDLL